MALQTLRAGGLNGDMVITPAGEIFTLEIIGTVPELIPMGSLVGPKGDDGPGVTVPPHD